VVPQRRSSNWSSGSQLGHVRPPRPSSCALISAGFGVARAGWHIHPKPAATRPREAEAPSRDLTVAIQAWIWPVLQHPLKVSLENGSSRQLRTAVLVKEGILHGRKDACGGCRFKLQARPGWIGQPTGHPGGEPDPERGQFRVQSHARVVVVGALVALADQLFGRVQDRPHHARAWVHFGSEGCSKVSLSLSCCLFDPAPTPFAG